jgi:competence protein ComEC
LQFLFEPTQTQRELAGLPKRIQVRWYQDASDVRPGQTWRLKLRLRPPRGLVNFQGFDRERALFAAGIGALATVRAASPLDQPPAGYFAHRIRAIVADRIREMLPPGKGRALVLSLAIADRSELDEEAWASLRATGTGHLLAISGLHIGLAAVAGFWLTRVLLFLVFPSGGRSVFSACCFGSFLVALAYGALAGFPVSTIRALVMLAAGLCVIASRRNAHAFRAWWIAFLIVLLIDPFSVLTAGFWLSFGAVIALIACFAPREGSLSWWAALPQAQLAVMVVMLPLAAFWFQSGSWLSLPTNLLAIPFVSFLVVPLVLLGVALSGWPLLAQAVLELASWACSGLDAFLGGMSALEGGRRWLTPAVRAVTRDSDAGHCTRAWWPGLAIGHGQWAAYRCGRCTLHSWTTTAVAKWAWGNGRYAARPNTAVPRQ